MNHHFTRVVDLSHRLSPNMPGWPTQPPLSFKTIKTIEADGYSLTLIDKMVTHTGTHLDAPAHFLPGGATIEKIPFDSLSGEGIVLNLSQKKPAEEITRGDLQLFDDEILHGDVVFVRTGWDSKFGMNDDYLFRWPYLGNDAAKYLVSKNVKAFGTDGLSVGGWGESVPDHPSTAKSPGDEVHRILLAANVIIVEMLANLESVLKGMSFGRGYFIFAPLNFIGTEGSPCRAIGLLR